MSQPVFAFSTLGAPFWVLGFSEDRKFDPRERDEQMANQHQRAPSQFAVLEVSSM